MAFEIKTEDWYPQHKPLDYPKEFIAWIDSINKGWQNQIKYKPFETYKKQANLSAKKTNAV